MRILLTGAGSWLGRTLVQRLHREHQLLSLGEPAEGAVEAAGRLGDEPSLRRALEGVQVVLHMASATGEDGRSGLLQAASWARVKRVVWVGHAGTLDQRGRSPALERLRLASQAACGTETPAVSLLQPATMLGPGRPGGPPPVIQAWLDGRVHSAPGGGLAFVDVRDVGGAVEAAMTRGPTGVGLPLAAAAWSFQAFYSTLAHLSGRTPPPPDPRHWLAGEHPPELDPAGLAWQVDSRQARDALGWWTRSPDRSLGDTLADAGVVRG